MAPTDWLDLHAGAIQGISAVILVIVTIILAWVTWTYAVAAKRQAAEAEKQVVETQHQRFDQHRPVVHPLGNLPLTQNGGLDWSRPDYELRLQNVGTGVALTVCGVLFPPVPATPSKILSPRYTVWREPALLPGVSERSVTLELGRTIMEGDAAIAEHRLFAPRSPTQQERMLGGQYNVPARLTLTYEDIFMRKHTAVFDYIDIYGWQCVALLADAPRNLEDIDAEVRQKIFAAATRSATTALGH